MIASLFGQPAVLLDLETTGASPSRDRITEIGLIELDPVAPGQTTADAGWSTLVRPGIPIPPFITGLTGIDDDMVAAAPPFADIAPALARRLDGRLLIAHNVKFDHGFLRAEFERVGIRFAVPVLCSAKLSRKLYPQHHRHNLDSLIERHRLHCADRHRALGDARVIGEFLAAASAELGAGRVAEVAAALVTPASAPRQVIDWIDDLPDGPGCFTLRAADGSVLYVGTGASMRGEAARLLQRSNALGRALLAEAATIDFERHAGVLGATLAQRRLIERLAPRHQPARAGSRGAAGDAHRESWQLTWQAETGGNRGAAFRLREAGESVAAATAGTARDAAREPAFGDFPDEPTARRALTAFAREHRLCLPLLGLTASPVSAGDPSRCVHHARGECLGACLPADRSRETPAAHLGRALTALARLPRPATPVHAGLVGYRETDADGRTTIHVFDGASYLGSAEDADALAALLDRPSPATDGDTPVDLQPLRILTRLLKAPGVRVERIRLVHP